MVVSTGGKCIQRSAKKTAKVGSLLSELMVWVAPTEKLQERYGHQLAESLAHWGLPRKRKTGIHSLGDRGRQKSKRGASRKKGGV